MTLQDFLNDPKVFGFWFGQRGLIVKFPGPIIIYLKCPFDYYLRLAGGDVLQVVNGNTNALLGSFPILAQQPFPIFLNGQAYLDRKQLLEDFMGYVAKFTCDGGCC